MPLLVGRLSFCRVEEHWPVSVAPLESVINYLPNSEFSQYTIGLPSWNVFIF